MAVSGDQNMASIPSVGMEFTTTEEAFNFWKKYANNTGFGYRQRGINRRKKDGVITSMILVCYKEGEKKEDPHRLNSRHRDNVRCNCPVRMTISLNKETRKYKVTTFIGDHNHQLEGAQTTHRLRSHRNVNECQKRAIDIALQVGLGPKMTHEYMSMEVGGAELVGFTREDVKSYLRTKSATELKFGEVGLICEYFQQQTMRSPSFFHQYQLDCDGHITNMFWADTKMRVDYVAFGDVLTFDTTFGTNRDWRPLGVFCGFNNHRETVIFGGALLFDETAASFAWLFKTFFMCHGGKEPRIIFTDQDAAMARALTVVMPNVRHGLCTWHISQNALKNLAGKLGSSTNGFMKAFHTCMYGFTDVDTFEEQWENLKMAYSLEDDRWLSVIYEKRSMWSAAYLRDTFTAGIRSTQLSESFNAQLKEHMRSDHTISRFFSRFEKVVGYVREKEHGSDTRMRQTSPHLSVTRSSILRQAAMWYTPHMFKEFHDQWDLSHAVDIDICGVVDVPHKRTATVDGEGEVSYIISFDPSTMTISCTCFRFEMCGYLCGHILRVFEFSRVKEIPEKYLIKLHEKMIEKKG